MAVISALDDNNFTNLAELQAAIDKNGGPRAVPKAEKVLKKAVCHKCNFRMRM